MTDDLLLKVSNLTLAVGALPVINNLNFSIKRREMLGIVGESGSGKTLASRAVLDLTPPAVSRVSGNIVFEGRDLGSLAPAELRSVRGAGIAMVFQEPMTSLNPALTVGKQLDEGLEIHTDLNAAARREIVLKMLDRVGISGGESVLGAHPHQFSGGMRQRIMLASAMVLKPRLLIADEPTTALDAVIQREVMELMVELSAENDTAILLISHDLPMIARYCDRVLVMQDGEIREEGPTDKVIANPQHSYTRRLLSTLPRRGPVRPQRTGTPIVAAQDIAVEFAGHRKLFRPKTTKQALKGVSVEIRPGEVVAVVGGSGSGKTTLARVIAGLQKTNSGTLLWQGQAIGSDRAHTRDYRTNCQMVFQDPYSSLDPRMRVFEIVDEALRGMGLASGERKTRVTQALDEVGLGNALSKRFPHELSGGQRQRVAIARAIIRRPDFIIADEAVSALDVTVRAQVLDLFADLQRRYGFSCLFITHDLGVVEQIADRVIVMRDGEIVEEGPRDAIFDTPKTAYTRELLSAVPVLETIEGGGVALKWRSEAEASVSAR